jgi:hypothetical protein
VADENLRRILRTARGEAALTPEKRRQGDLVDPKGRPHRLLVNAGHHEDSIEVGPVLATTPERAPPTAAASLGAEKTHLNDK